ncbi:MAG TPA: deoxyribonuclease HsdR, partial [Armatimonadota bacterium]|nr:deoxyribonuclease HsdR [Armatimonadota bacterium]
MFARFAAAWDRFFFEPVLPTSIAAYRAVFGLLVLLNLLAFWPDRMTWFSDAGVFSQDTAAHFFGPRLSLLPLLPPGPFWLDAFFVLLMLAAVCQMLGVCTRLSSVLVFLGLVSLHHRNLVILNGADIVLRV